MFSLRKPLIFHFARPTDSDRPRDRQVQAHGDPSAPLCSSAPCPISLKSTLLNHTSRYPGGRTRGAHLTPTPDPSRGRRIDWPTATATNPGKIRGTPIAAVVSTFFRPGAPLVSVVAMCFDTAYDSKCEELFATVSDRHRRRHVFRHNV